MVTRERLEIAEQVRNFKTGNEMAALAAQQINFHLMGYYPITPSTEIAELLEEMKSEAKHDIVMIPADGEHGAAGVCFGAACGGGRVYNATSAQGLLYSLEQLPAQAGTRLPMVLALVTRSVSSPLDIRGDHSDLYFTFNTGWIVLLARDPQAVYDLHIVATKIGEQEEVRLPVIIAYDGFFTSHQKRQVQYFKEPEVVQTFLGSPPSFPHALNPRRPITIGPYMNDPDLIINKYQAKLAMEAAHRLLPQLFAEYAALSGRYYPLVDCYRMEDAEVAVLLLNSAAETAKDATDRLRSRGLKVGVISPNLLRPFPAQEVREACRNLKALLIGERADSYGAHGNHLTHEVKSALKDDPQNRTLCLSRIYGLGGKDFYAEDAEAFFRQALEAVERGYVDVAFDYHGVDGSDGRDYSLPTVAPIPREEATTGLISIDRGPDGRLKVSTPPAWQLVTKPKRIAPGHGACPGCGIFPALDQFFKGLEGDVVVLYQTGCAQVVTTGYPYSAHRVTYIHNLFQNGAATLSGLVETFHERKRRGEIPASGDITFVMISGDGGMDIGLGSALGTAVRNHNLIILEYDNQGYMNTGSQLSYSTPFGHMTSTSQVGSQKAGKSFHHRDTPQIMAACHIPYVFTTIEGFPDDLISKAAKAQWYARNKGMVYGKILISCPLNWRCDDRTGTTIVRAAVDSCFFPVYEVEEGKTCITYDPEAAGRSIPLADWLGMMGKCKHLLAPENAPFLAALETEVERRWRRLKAMHEHPLL